MHEQDRDVSEERARCAALVRAVIDSLPVPTSLSLVITAERMFDGPATPASILAERQRCIAIVDAAAARPFDQRPAFWALAAIESGLTVEEALAQADGWEKCRSTLDR